MKRLLGFVALATVVIFGLSMNASAASGPKIGFVDIQGAILQSNWGKRVADNLKKEQEKLSSELDQKGQSFKAAQEEFSKKSSLMDEKARARKQKELQDMAAELQKALSESNQRLNADRAQALRPIQDKIGEIMRKVAADDKYDFIIEKGALVYGNSKDDLTRRLASELDKNAPR